MPTMASALFIKQTGKGEAAVAYNGVLGLYTAPTSKAGQIASLKKPALAAKIPNFAKIVASTGSTVGCHPALAA